MPIANRKPYKGLGMEGLIARWYTRTRSNDLGEFRSQARRAAERLKAGTPVLEVAPGPGFFAIELAKLGDFKVTGLDISRTFVEIAAANAQSAGVNVDFRHGSASAMPFADGSFDFIYCLAAFKNFSEPLKALDEMNRVLRPGGEAVIIDLRKDCSLDEINAYIKRSGRRRLDALMTRWTFRGLLIKRAYSTDEFQNLARQSRFGSCQLVLDEIGFEARLTKPNREEPCLADHLSDARRHEDACAT
jgi:ubiquinone/menaquinone biosynthesis C-methylase UbiE